MKPTLVECSFLIPVRRDALMSDGKPHEPVAWDRLEDELYVRLMSGTTAPGLYVGFYTDPDTGQKVSDESRRMIVAIPEQRVDDLRQLISEACDWFQQKCIYLSIAGRVEFIGGK